MASSLTFRKFVVSNLLNRSVVHFCLPSSRSLHTHDHNSNRVHRPTSIANAFRTTCYFLYDLLPWSPVRLISFRLNSLESGVLGPARHPGSWKVRQNTEALKLHREISGSGKETMAYLNVSIERNSDIRNGPRNRFLVDGISKNLEHKSVIQPAVLVIERQILQKSEGYHEEDLFGTYTVLIDLPCDLYDTNAIKIEQRNQVVDIIVPKLKPEWIYKVNILCEW